MSTSLFPVGMSIEAKIGQMLVIGFPAGEEGLEQLERAVGEFAVGNVIIFSRNVATPRELYATIERAHEIILRGTGIPPLVSIDQEGGIVRRLREGLTPIPGAMAQAAAVAGGRQGLAELRTLAGICGSELATLGINWDLAPVVDVNVDPANPVIGVRSYGDEPRRVADLASAFAAGLSDSGMLATAKHFPGHGDTRVDSHYGLPTIPHGLDRLEAVELLPFRRLINEGIGAIMTAHVVFPAVGGGDLPATLSTAIVEGLLRGRLGFDGLVTTDCMEMKAMTDHFPDAALLAVEAGVDIVEVSHTYERQKEAAESLAAALRAGRLTEARIDRSLRRIEAVKARLVKPAPSWEEARVRLARPESLAFAGTFYRDALTLLRAGPGLPPRPGFLYVDLAPGAGIGADDSAASGPPPETVASYLAASGVPCEGIVLPADPTDVQVRGALKRSAGRDLILGIHDVGRHPGQRSLALALARAAASSGRNLALVSMRSPYDLRVIDDALADGGLDPVGACLCAYEYCPESAEAVADFLTGRGEAPGRAPVSLP